MWKIGTGQLYARQHRIRTSAVDCGKINTSLRDKGRAGYKVILKLLKEEGKTRIFTSAITVSKSRGKFFQNTVLNILIS